ncbi:MAG: OadG family protein [Candidatus Galacturonibacter soehngenii]|nr:OadG family protein [Candidatus Galacturonibacter soehngenii]
MQEIGSLQVVFMGMGTVFISLIILIVMIIVMGKIMQILVKDVSPKKQEQTSVIGVDKVEKQKIIAAISVAIAEELKTDVSKIQIHSITSLKSNKE